MMVNEICEKKYNKPLSGCTNEEIYYALLDMTKDLAAKNRENMSPGSDVLSYIICIVQLQERQ